MRERENNDIVGEKNNSLLLGLQQGLVFLPLRQFNQIKILLMEKTLVISNKWNGIEMNEVKYNKITIPLFKYFYYRM
jgi:hypothetical protein